MISNELDSVFEEMTYFRVEGLRRIVKEGVSGTVKVIDVQLLRLKNRGTGKHMW